MILKIGVLGRDPKVLFKREFRSSSGIADFTLRQNNLFRAPRQSIPFKSLQCKKQKHKIGFQEKAGADDVLFRHRVSSFF